MSLAERLGSRRGFNRDVQYIGNGKPGYQRHISQYANTQKVVSRNQNQSKKPTINVTNSLSEVEIAACKKYLNTVKEYRDVYGSLKELDDIEVEIKNLYEIEKLSIEINNNHFIDSAKYTSKINEYRGIYEDTINKKFKMLEEKYSLNSKTPAINTKAKLLTLYDIRINQKLKNFEKSLSLISKTSALGGVKDVNNLNILNTLTSDNISKKSEEVNKNINGRFNLSEELQKRLDEERHILEEREKQLKLKFEKLIDDERKHNIKKEFEIKMELELKAQQEEDRIKKEI
jgi:hypothetical protein